MRTARWAWQKFAQKVYPAGAYEEGVDCTLPRPMMLIMACFMAVRFEFLSPGHQ